MPENAATPAAAAAAPAASSAPTAVSTPASAPAATAAPVATPPATAPATTEAAAPAITGADAGKSTFQIMQEQNAARAAAAEADKPAVVDPASTDDPAAGSEGEAADDLTDDVVGDLEEKEGEQGNAGEEENPFKDFDFDPQPVAAKELSEKISADPAIAAALEANPELKNIVFANARLAADTAAFKEVFGTPEEARVAADGHDTFVKIASSMASIKDGDAGTLGTTLSTMLEASAIRDDSGQLQYDDKGNLVTDGSVGRFLRNSFQNRLEQFASKFVEAGDEEGQAAIDILMERAGLRAPSSPNEEEMSAEMRAESERIKTERNALNQERQTRAAEVAKEYHTAVNSRIDTMMDAGIKAVLDRASGLTAFERRTAEREIREGLAAEIKGNYRFQREMELLDAKPFGADRQREHMKLATRYFQTGLGKVAIKVLADAGASLTSKQQQQTNKSAARSEAARSETRGALPVAKTGPVLTGAAATSNVAADLRKTLGRSPTTLEVMQEGIKRASTTAA